MLVSSELNVFRFTKYPTILLTSKFMHLQIVRNKYTHAYTEYGIEIKSCSNNVDTEIGVVSMRSFSETCSRDIFNFTAAVKRFVNGMLGQILK